MLSAGCGQTQAYRCTNHKLWVSCTPRHSTWVGKISRVGLLCPTSWPDNMLQTSMLEFVSKLSVSVKPPFGCHLHSTLWCTPEWSGMHLPIYLRAGLKLVRKYTSSTSKGMVSSSITNCNLSGSQYPISSCSKDISDLMDEVWKYFSNPHYLRAFTTSRWFNTSLSAPSCSLSRHSMTMMSKHVKKHQSLSSIVHSTEKDSQKTNFLSHMQTFPTCGCVYMRPGQGTPMCRSFHTRGSLVGPMCAQLGINRALLLRWKSKNFKIKHQINMMG